MSTNPHQVLYAAKRIRQALADLLKPLENPALSMEERKLQFKTAAKHAAHVVKETEWIDSAR